MLQAINWSIFITPDRNIKPPPSHTTKIRRKYDRIGVYKFMYIVYIKGVGENTHTTNTTHNELQHNHKAVDRVSFKHPFI